MEKSKYYVVRDKALPEVLQKVAEAKQLLDKNRSMTVQEATERLGLSRSSFINIKMTSLPFRTIPGEDGDPGDPDGG